MKIRRHNPTIAALDRAAERMAIDLVKLGENQREFLYTPTNRTIRYKPGGKGVLTVDSYIGDVMLATASRTAEGVERLFVRMREYRDAQE